MYKKWTMFKSVRKWTESSVLHISGAQRQKIFRERNRPDITSLSQNLKKEKIKEGGISTRKFFEFQIIVSKNFPLLRAGRIPPKQPLQVYSKVPPWRGVFYQFSRSLALSIEGTFAPIKVRPSVALTAETLSSLPSPPKGGNAYHLTCTTCNFLTQHNFASNQQCCHK